MRQLVGLDFETYSDVDLPKHGLDRYVASKYFTPLLASVAKIENYGTISDTCSIEQGVEHMRRWLQAMVDQGVTFVAHNAAFELAVLRWLGVRLPAGRIIDSAVVARAVGAGSSLEAAAAQLLGTEKMEAGKNLIKVFCIPGPLQEKFETRGFVADVILQNPEDWKTFIQYCELDARLSLRIADEYMKLLGPNELKYQDVTLEMNQRGWHVDIKIVEEFNRRYLENQAVAYEHFKDRVGTTLNLASHAQLKAWCLERGVRASSFDEKHVASLTKRLHKKLADDLTLSPEKVENYSQVLDMLKTKQILGGSSLKKLKTILDTVGSDSRLRDQYLHCGAGQSLRTTGRSAQMQNLKRIGVPADMDQIFDDSIHWDNDRLASNLRQVFTATDPNGTLIVGDFKSVESRKLAWLAGEDWKTKAYKSNRDMYVELASRLFDLPIESITKDQRQLGKVGELSCGYQAGPGAVKDFAAKMGTDLSEGEASKLVIDWRAANPNIVALWDKLDSMLHHALDATAGETTHVLPDGFLVQIRRCFTPMSLQEQAARQGRHVQSLELVVEHLGKHFMSRFFHGCYSHGRNVRYYKPTDRKTGDLWRDTFVDPKTKQTRYYEIYGGKLAGILTQSFCREHFMAAMLRVSDWCWKVGNVGLVGQFHDELVLDWEPGSRPEHATEAEAKYMLDQFMSDPGLAKSFPLAADIKTDYHYTK